MKKTFTPSMPGLLALLDARAVRTREALSVAGSKGWRERERLKYQRRRAHWKRHTGGIVGRGWTKRLLALPGYQMLVARMEPGEWYASPDMRDLLPEYADKSARIWAVQLRKLGLTERTVNPLHDTSKPPGSQSEAQWLHRLTARGEELSRQWRSVLEAAGKS